MNVAADATARAIEPAAPSPAPVIARTPSTPVVDPGGTRSGGLDPVFFWIGAGLTAVLGGVTIGSGVDANQRYDDFAAARTVETRDAGQSAELRTNILLGSTIAVAAVTGVVGLWLTRWGGGREVR